MNSRAKGARTQRKAIARLHQLYPDAVVLTMAQASRFATPQPFDLLVFRPWHPVLLVEVRTNQWGTGKPQTKQLASLPGIMERQLWMYTDGCLDPRIRTFSVSGWK